jgi:hypothetical protein
MDVALLPHDGRWPPSDAGPTKLGHMLFTALLAPPTAGMENVYSSGRPPREESTGRGDIATAEASMEEGGRLGWDPHLLTGVTSLDDRL